MLEASGGSSSSEATSLGGLLSLVMDSKFVAGGGELVIGGNVLLEGGLLSLVMYSKFLAGERGSWSLEAMCC